jgi:hypothetical protein
MTPALNNPQNSSLQPTPVATPMRRCLKTAILKHWKPEEIRPPTVDPDLPYQTGVERSAEVFRYSVLAVEHWLSPTGCVREWLRFNARIAIILAVPSVMIVPMITYSLTQFTTWTTLLVQTTSNLILFPLSALLMVGLVSAVVFLAKSLQGRYPRRPPPGFYE